MDGDRLCNQNNEAMRLAAPLLAALLLAAGALAQRPDKAYFASHLDEVLQLWRQATDCTQDPDVYALEDYDGDGNNELYVEKGGTVCGMVVRRAADGVRLAGCRAHDGAMTAYGTFSWEGVSPRPLNRLDDLALLKEGRWRGKRRMDERMYEAAEGEKAPAMLVTPSASDKVKVRTAPSNGAPVAEGTQNGETGEVCIYPGVLYPAVRELGGWYKLESEYDDHWVSGAAAHRVGKDGQMEARMYSPNAYRTTVEAKPCSLRVTPLGEGFYALQAGNRVYWGCKAGGVLVFRERCTAMLEYSEKAAYDVTLVAQSGCNATIRVVYGKDKATRLSDGTIGLDYAKLDPLELHFLFQHAKACKGEEVYLTAGFFAEDSLVK